jgi:hypothetical protein
MDRQHDLQLPAAIVAGIVAGLNAHLTTAG